MQKKPLLQSKWRVVFVLCIVTILIITGLVGWLIIRPQSNTDNNLPPQAVVLNTPGILDIDENSIWLEWSMNTDKDFSRYEIHKSTIKDFKISTSTLLDIKRTQDYTYDLVIGLNPSTIYYFKVRTYDSGNLFSDSNEIGATTLPPNTAPQQVVLSQPTDIGATTLTLKWTKNHDDDFRQYTVAGSTDPNFEIDSDNTITTINDQNQNTYSIKDLISNTTYYFIVRTIDTKGLYSDSNKVEVLTAIISIFIDYDANWTGSIGDETGQRTIDGNSPTSYIMKGGIVVAVIQKGDNSSDALTIQILEGNRVQETQSTTAAYGVVSVSHSF